MRDKGKPGLLNIRLAIDPAGEVVDCHVQSQVADPEFVQTACASLKKSRFKPALNKDGNPIASYWVRSIYYVFG